MQREAGVLLSVSSLPSKEGIGTLGEGAYAFVDGLRAGGFTIWQVLPLTPTREGNSPYSSIAAFALNPLFIDLFALVKEGLLQEEEIFCSAGEKVDYEKVKREKAKSLRLAFSRFDIENADFAAFLRENEYKDYAMFATMLEYFDGKLFYDWGEGLSVYDEEKAEAFLAAHRAEYLYHLFTQYLFLKQWRALKAYANGVGIKILGDMPIYLALNSAEVYKYPELFLLGEGRRPSKVAGVPPDYFNAEGQLWGNPLYDWAYMKETGYRWWRERIARELELFDYLRIDHFRGLDRFYAVEADASDAKHGVWMQGPGAALFEGLLDEPIIAEDLGYIDESLRKMLSDVGFPGMKVYEFGLDGDPWNEHKPANYKENVVAYTGTHDNMPLCGYLRALSEKEFAVAARDILVQATVLEVSLEEVLGDVKAEIPASDRAAFVSALTKPYPEDAAAKQAEIRARVALLERVDMSYFGALDSRRLTHTAVATVLASKAKCAVFPMQDLLALGAESRMNTPALVSEENWAWRMTKEMIGRLAERKASR